MERTTEMMPNKRKNEDGGGPSSPVKNGEHNPTKIYKIDSLLLKYK